MKNGEKEGNWSNWMGINLSQAKNNKMVIKSDWKQLCISVTINLHVRHFEEKC